jgi:hypothetical protein
MTRAPLAGPSVWRNDELERSGAWIRRFAPLHLVEIEAALKGLRRRGIGAIGFDRAAFPLDATARFLDEVNRALEDGPGAIRLRGLPVAGYTEAELRLVFWGLGLHLGTPLYQNPDGEIMGAVRDETRDAAPTFVRTGPDQVQTSRARARSSGPLRWHTDRCDVIALFCVRNAMAGGLSRIASIPAIHNLFLERRPDLLDLLFQDYWRARPKEEDGVYATPTFPLPVFGLRDGRITSQYSRTYVEQGQEFAATPRLSAAQNEALDLLAAYADEVCLEVPFEVGDIQLCNNHLVYHGRTAYQDDAARGQDRLLLRLWLAPRNSRALPEGFAHYWGSTEPGAVRGGVPQRDGRRTPFAEPALETAR